MTTNPFIPTVNGLTPNAGLLGSPGAIVGKSLTPQTIGLGSFTWTTQAQAAWAPGMWVSATNPSNANQWMWGIVQSYDGVSQLTVNISDTSGSGTIANWQIALAGPPGATGATGTTGATGPMGTNSGPIISRSIGLKIVNHTGTENSKIDINSLQCMLTNSSGIAIVKSPVAITIDLTTGTSVSAANGMDGEAVPTSNWLYLYLISNGTAIAGLATTTAPQSGAPTLPSGYTFSQYVGAMLTDSSANLMRTLQFGRNTQYLVTTATNTAAMPVMGNTSTGSISSPTWSAIAIGTYVPVTASRIRGAVGGASVAIIMVAPNNSYGAYNSATNPPPIAFGDGNTDATTSFDLLLESANIYWANNAASQIYCLGWEDYFVAA